MDSADEVSTDTVDGSSSPAVTRRRFLIWGGSCTAGAVVAGLCAIAVPPAVATMFRDQNAGWTPIGRIDSLEPGQPDLSTPGTVFTSSYSRTVVDAFMPAEKQRTPVFIVSEGGDRFTVFDARCTHLGCPLAWSSTSHEFLCACHGAVFDQRGEIKGGPPPRPLDRYDWKVENGVLYVGRLRKGGS